MAMGQLNASQNFHKQTQPSATAALRQELQTQQPSQWQLSEAQAGQRKAKEQEASVVVSISSNGTEYLATKAATPVNDSTGAIRIETEQENPVPLSGATESQEASEVTAKDQARAAADTLQLDNSSPADPKVQPPSPDQKTTSAQPTNAEQNAARRTEQAEKKALNSQAVQGYQNISLRSRINGTQIDESV